MNARAHKRDGTHLPEMLGYNVRMAGKKSDKMEYTKEYVYQVFDGRVRDRIEDVKRMFFEGYSFTDVAKELDVSNSLLWSMMRNKNPRYDALREAMTFGEFAVGNVEQSLYRKATGYYYYEDQQLITIDVVPDDEVTDNDAFARTMSETLHSAFPHQRFSIVVDRNYSE